MCSTCGCNQQEGVKITKVNEPEFTAAESAPLIEVTHHHGTQSRTILLEQDILSHNNLEAAHNRYHFRSSGMLAINLVSSPGSGKTTLLETTLRHSGGRFRFYVIEGDQQTLNDANRIAATGCDVVQINTGKGCHLDASMVHRAVHRLKPAPDSIVFIENVGNLVCPALFDLGEAARVVIMSVTEGDDKPLKYPDIFESSQLCIINKSDLLPYVNFSVANAIDNALRVNRELEFIVLSATNGEGMTQWYDWLQRQKEQMLSHAINNEIQTV